MGNKDLLTVPGKEGGATVLMLHGFGASAEDLYPLSQLYPDATWLFPNGPLEIPIMPGYNGRAWFPVDIEGLQQALQEGNFDAVANAFPPELTEARERIDWLIDDLEIPRSKLIIGGFSQGAVLAIETALHSVEPVAALLIFSGTLVAEPEWRRLSHAHAKTRFFQSHGKNDTLLPFKKAEELGALLREVA